MSEPKAPREFWVSEHWGGATIHWDGPPNYVAEYYHASGKLYHVREVTGPDYKEIAEGLMEALKYVVSREDFTFAECSDAEDIISKVRAAIEAARQKGMR
jgi:hypothetical protein